MKWIITLLVRFYQILLRPVMRALGGPGTGCRFSPSCSNYMLEAVEVHGAWRGGFMGICRILRCHPWGKCGYDPVPPADDQAKTAELLQDTTDFSTNRPKGH